MYGKYKGKSRKTAVWSSNKMPKKQWTSVLITVKTYDRLNKLKRERKKEKKVIRYSFSDFIDYLCSLYEQNLDEINPGPTIQQIQEMG